MIWHAGVTVMRPDSAVKLAEMEKPKRGFLQRLCDSFFVKNETEPAADPAPVPVAYGKVIADGGFSITRPSGAQHSTLLTWRGQPLSDTQYWFDAIRMQWKPKRSATLPYLCAEYNDLVCDEFTVVEWNDMSEFNRLQKMGEWHKVKGLAAHGIAMSPADVAAERELQRQEAKLKAMELAFQMENHKRKLEKELVEAEEREHHYQQNEIFGAF